MLGVLVLGTIAPVEASKVKPDGLALYTPPVKALVPVIVTACEAVRLLQYGVPA